MSVYWDPCDIDHNLQVNMKDIGKSAKSFGSMPSDDLWNPHADKTGTEPLVPDGKVDMRDVRFIARHFGDHYTCVLAGRSAGVRTWYFTVLCCLCF
jgi:hypothetical protein